MNWKLEDIDFNASEREYQRLKRENEQLKDKEIERLRTLLNAKDNIINELERYLEQKWLEWKDDSSDEIAAMANEDKCILDKLQELKGDSNNE